ncbi:DUF4347 domain-containing protein, partial [Photobacterium aquimaris]|uniref:DUF4347 domain-containing protein n=1 Tax=Photobacterium aquimaris TaxID=512643 RepID=UPI001F2D77C5
MNLIDIFSHSEAEKIIIGQDEITLNNIDNYKQQLNQLGQHLSEHAHINLLGCDIAQTDAGKLLVDKFAQYTGVSVAASNDKTGASELGGDWDLEYVSKVNRFTYFPSDFSLYKEYPSVLGDIANSLVGWMTNGGGCYTSDQYGYWWGPAEINSLQSGWNTAVLVDTPHQRVLGSAISSNTSGAQCVLSSNGSQDLNDPVGSNHYVEYQFETRNFDPTSVIYELGSMGWVENRTSKVEIRLSSDDFATHTLIHSPSANINTQFFEFTNPTLLEPNKFYKMRVYFYSIVSVEMSDVNIAGTRTYAPADFGDAPDTSAATGVNNYQTLRSNNGPEHFVDEDLYIGSTAPDLEDGDQQDITATSDDSDGVDDEGGLNIPPIQSSSTDYKIYLPITNNTGGKATLVGWIDFNRNGQFEESEGQLVQIPSGVTQVNTELEWNGISPSSSTHLYLRLRLVNRVVTGISDISSLGVDGYGEVEDHRIEMQDIDLGDAPDSYGIDPTLGGAYHVITNTSNLYLGNSTIDTDT